MNINSLNSVQSFSALKNLQENNTVTNPNFNAEEQVEEPSKQMVNAQTALASYTMPKVNMSFKGSLQDDEMSDEEFEQKKKEFAKKHKDFPFYLISKNEKFNLTKINIDIALKAMDVRKKLLYHETLVANAFFDYDYKVINYIKNKEQVELVNKIFDNESLCCDGKYFENAVFIIDSVKSKEQAQIADKILNNENLYSNQQLLKNASNIINSVKTEEQSQIANEILKDEKIYKNPLIINNAQYVINSANKNNINKILPFIEHMVDKEQLKQEKIFDVEKLLQFCEFDNKKLDEILNNFEKNKNQIKEIESFKCENYTVPKQLIYNVLLGMTNDYSKMDLRYKTVAIHCLKDLLKNQSLDREIIKNEIDKIENSIKHVISPIEINETQYINMMSEFFTNNNQKLDNTLSRANFEKFGKQGLPLRYSRKDFIYDLKTNLNGLTDAEKQNILQKLGIKLNEKNGYDGIIDLSKLSTEGKEGEILKLATRFMKENSINTGNKKLDNALNSLIQGMPEFINVIGKTQHETHDYSLDIHILTVLKNAMAHPDYKKLTPDEKICLKFATVLHDIAKLEGIEDKGHPNISAFVCKRYFK